MVKDTQTIRRQIADEFFECVWPFFEIGAKRVKIIVTRLFHYVENKDVIVQWN